MSTIPVLHSDTQVYIPGVGNRDAKCLAEGYVALCHVPANEPAPKFSNAYEPTRGITISTMLMGRDSRGEVFCEKLVTIGPDQRNAAIAQWWLDNCFQNIKSIMQGFTGSEADIANGFGWWLSTDSRFIQVDRWARDTWHGFAVDILNNVEKKGMTFTQAAGIDV